MVDDALKDHLCIIYCQDKRRQGNGDEKSTEVVWLVLAVVLDLWAIADDESSGDDANWYVDKECPAPVGCDTKDGRTIG